MSLYAIYLLEIEYFINVCHLSLFIIHNRYNIIDDYIIVFFLINLYYYEKLKKISHYLELLT